MVAIAIIAGLFALGSFIDISVINHRSISSEQATLVSVLQKARNESINNINAIQHGVHIDTSAYTLFEGTNYISTNSSNQTIAKSSMTDISNINSNDFTAPYDIIFSQLSGEPSVIGVITLNNGATTKMITIYNGGLIDW